MPRLIGPGVGSPVGCRLLQPNCSAAIGKYFRHIAFGASRRQVLHPELQRVHPHLVGELVHQHLGEEAALRMAGRAHRALRARRSCRRRVWRPPAVREDVDVRQREARRRAGAAGAPRLGVERGEHAVGARRRP